MGYIAEPSQETLAACKAGNQDAFKEIFYRYRGYAFNLVYKITGPYGEHEDLVQEVFFQVYLSLRNFQGNSSFRTWFHRVIVNTCTAQWRFQGAEKRISNKNLTRIDDLDYEIAVQEPNHGKELEFKNLVEKVLEILDDKLRIPLVLNVYSEMNLSEIAIVMGIPEGTVKSRLFTARKLIKEYLDTLEP